MDFSQFVLTVLDKYGVEVAVLITLVFGLTIVTIRSVPSMLKAISTFMQTRATAAATVQTTEVQNESKVLDILQQQVSNAQTTNNILLQYQTELAQGRHTTERVAGGLERMTMGLEGMERENRALRISLESWPKTVDATLAGSTTAIEQMLKSIDAMKAENDASHKVVRDKIETMAMQVDFVYQRVKKAAEKPEPPPTEPADAPKPEPGNILHADAGASDAVQLPKAQDAA